MISLRSDGIQFRKTMLSGLAEAGTIGLGRLALNDLPKPFGLGRSILGRLVQANWPRPAAV